MNVIINAIDNGIITLPAEVISSYPFADYTYDSYLCERDMGYNLTGILKDLRYGGNEQSRYNAGTYWNGEVSVLTGNRQPEIQTKNEIKNNEILALAFGKDAAQEMRDRVKEKTGIDIEIRTFHSTGKKIIESIKNKKLKKFWNIYKKFIKPI